MEMSEKKSNKGLIAIIIILLLIIVGLIGFMVINNYNNKKDDNPEKDNTEKVEDKVTEEKEVTLSQYQYLYDKYINEAIFYSETETNDITFKSIYNSYFLDIAINELEKEWEKINSTDYEAKISGTKVDAKMKELFGNDFSYKNESFNLHIGAVYNANENVYYLHHNYGRVSEHENISSAVKATVKDDEVYIYILAGSIKEDFDNHTYTLYGTVNENNPLKANITFNNDFYIDNVSTSEYLKSHSNSFLQYKLTFKKNGDNYIFTNMELVK